MDRVRRRLNNAPSHEYANEEKPFADALATLAIHAITHFVPRTGSESEGTNCSLLPSKNIFAMKPPVFLQRLLKPKSALPVE
jgi:hypothetical protein